MFEPSRWQDKLFHWSYKVWPYRWRPRELWYRFKCRVWHRYTTVKPRTLPWHTWTDRSTLLPHCMFEILTQFIEGECSPGIIDWEGSGHMIPGPDGNEVNVRTVMRELYDWWDKRPEDTEFSDRTIYDEYEKTWARMDALSKLRSRPCEDGEYHEIYTEYFCPEGQSVEDAAAEYHDLMKHCNELRNKDQELLICNMQKLCQLQPYLWT